MHQNTLNTIHRWLQQANHDISLTDLKRRFLSHPDVGTLNSITETLNDFKIENQAAHIDRQSLAQLTEPFLAFIKDDQTEEFVIVTMSETKEVKLYNGLGQPFSISLTKFQQIFTGIVVIIDQQPKRNNFKVKNWGNPLILTISLLAVLYLFWHKLPENTNGYLYFIFAAIGLLFSSILFAQNNGASNDLLKRFCTLSSKSDCNTVLQSKAAKLGKHLNLTDIGLIYFVTQCLFLLVTPSNIAILFAISLAALAFPLYSIYQQAFVIKKWCPFCLGAVAVLLIQGIVAFIALPKINLTLSGIPSFICIGVLIVIGWYYLTPIIDYEKQELQEQAYHAHPKSVFVDNT
jgi:uncharacterized membrane protein